MKSYDTRANKIAINSKLHYIVIVEEDHAKSIFYSPVHSSTMRSSFCLTKKAEIDGKYKEVRVGATQV
jgi:hypothetical protein